MPESHTDASASESHERCGSLSVDRRNEGRYTRRDTRREAQRGRGARDARETRRVGQHLDGPQSRGRRARRPRRAPTDSGAESPNNSGRSRRQARGDVALGSGRSIAIGDASRRAPLRSETRHSSGERSPPARQENRRSDERAGGRYREDAIPRESSGPTLRQEIRRSDERGVGRQTGGSTTRRGARRSDERDVDRRPKPTERRRATNEDTRHERCHVLVEWIKRSSSSGEFAPDAPCSVTHGAAQAVVALAPKVKGSAAVATEGNTAMSAGDCGARSSGNRVSKQGGPSEGNPEEASTAPTPVEGLTNEHSATSEPTGRGGGIGDEVDEEFSEQRDGTGLASRGSGTEPYRHTAVAAAKGLGWPLEVAARRPSNATANASARVIHYAR